MQQMGNENTQTYQEKVFIFIQHQLPVTSLQGKVWQLEERIDNQVLGVVYSQLADGPTRRHQLANV